MDCLLKAQQYTGSLPLVSVNMTIVFNNNTNVGDVFKGEGDEVNKKINCDLDVIEEDTNEQEVKNALRAIPGMKLSL
jgi:hypothetical protein